MCSGSWMAYRWLTHVYANYNLTTPLIAGVIDACVPSHAASRWWVAHRNASPACRQKRYENVDRHEFPLATSVDWSIASACSFLAFWKAKASFFSFAKAKHCIALRACPDQEMVVICALCLVIWLRCSSSSDSNSPYSIAHRVPVQSQQINEFKQKRSLSSLQLSHVSSWLQNTDVRTPFSGGMFLQDSGPLISSHPHCLDARDHCDPPSPRQFTAQLVTVRPAVRPCRLPTSSNGSKVDLYGSFMVDDGWWRLMTVDGIWMYLMDG